MPPERGSIGIQAAAAALLVPLAVHAQTPRAVSEERAGVLEALLLREPVSSAVDLRRDCAAGGAPRSVARSRAIGVTASPDAADGCAVALVRLGREGRLLEFYRDLQREVGGGGTAHEQLPAAIASALLKAKVDLVAVGNDRAAKISASLAFDAGFTVAYGKAERVSTAMPSLGDLKPIAERCLAKAEGNLGLCYSTGYVYGARAVSGMVVSMP